MTETHKENDQLIIDDTLVSNLVANGLVTLQSMEN